MSSKTNITNPTKFDTNFFEDNLDGSKIEIALQWNVKNAGVEVPISFNDGYCTLASAKNKYCIYRGVNPNLVGYIAIDLMDLIFVNNNRIISKIIDFPFDFNVNTLYVDAYGIATSGIELISKLREIGLEAPTTWHSQGGNNLPYVNIISTGKYPTISPKNGVLMDIKNIKNLTERLLDYIPKNNQVVLYKDVVFENGWIKLNSGALNLEIKNTTLLAKFGNGIFKLDHIIRYPSATTYNGFAGTYFYIRDTSGKLIKEADFEYISFFYDTATGNNVYNTLVDKLGINIVANNTAGDDAHATVLRNVFNAIYSDFPGTFHDTILDPVANYSTISNQFKATYCQLRDADLILRAYGGTGAETAANGSNPNILTVVAHYLNNFVEHNNLDYPNTIQVASRADDETYNSTGTSFGDGVTFFENLRKTHLEFPEFDIAWINPVDQESTTVFIVGIKLKKIKLATGANWGIVIEAAKATASNNGVWDKYRGFGIINMTAAINYINTNYKENLTYRAELAERVENEKGLPPYLQYSDLLPNSPVSKKMINDIEAGKIQRAVLEKTFVWDGNPYYVYANQEVFPFNQISVKSVQSFQISYSYKDTVNYYQYQDKTSQMISGNLDENTPSNWFINPTNWGQSIGTEFTIKILVDYIL